MSDEATERDLVDRMKSGSPYMVIGIENQQRAQRRAIAELRNENALLRQALYEAAIPLEVMHGLGHRWGHPLLNRRWRQLVSDDLRRQIAQAVSAIRETIRPTG